MSKSPLSQCLLRKAAISVSTWLETIAWRKVSVAYVPTSGCSEPSASDYYT